MKVKVVCTTDDPTDSLQHHRQLKAEGFEIPVLPAFRPDTAMKVDDPAAFNDYLLKLEKASDTAITSFSDYRDALKLSHDFFSANGCTVSDHGLENICAEDYTAKEIRKIFEKLRKGKTIDPEAAGKFRSAMLEQFAEWDAESGWVQQYHLGALRNNNSRMKKKLGPDTGWDSIGDFPQAVPLAKFLNRLDSHNRLAKTILYNSNPADNEVMATMIGNFNDGSVAGKIQWGAAWWFLDQKEGMVKQLNTLSNMGLLSRFIGMLTDSRSFLSFPRHEYFRRILCNLFGGEIERGELPDDMNWTGKIIQDICFHNAKNYFNW
jgi:glucuronate isomerase